METMFLICRLAHATVFAVSGLTKVYNRSGIREALLAFGIPVTVHEVWMALQSNP